MSYIKEFLNESFYEDEDVTYADYVSILSDAALGLHEDTLDYMTNRVSSLLETTLVINEGVNIEIYKKSSAVSKEYKFLCKALRKQLKAKQYTEAKATIENINAILNKGEKEIKAMKTTEVSSTVCGIIAAWLLWDLETFVPCFSVFTTGSLNSPEDAAGAAIELVPFLMIPGAIFAAIKALIKLVKDLIVLINNIKDDKTPTEDAMNLYKNRILRIFGEVKKNVAKIEASIDSVKEK